MLNRPSRLSREGPEKIPPRTFVPLPEFPVAEVEENVDHHYHDSAQIGVVADAVRENAVPVGPHFDVTAEVMAEIVPHGNQGIIGEIVCHDNQSVDNSDMTDEIPTYDPISSTAPRDVPKAGGEHRTRIPFEERLEQLASFRAKYGHVDVPRNYVTDPSLATFVCNQRQMYKRMNEGKGPSMNQSRINQLNNLGFKWVLRFEDQPKVVEDNIPSFELDQDDPQPAPSEDGESVIGLMASKGKVSKATGPAVSRRSRTLDWNDGIEELKSFQLQNGHLNVPHIFPANQPLGNFVKSIRQHYKQMQKGKASKFLKPERVTELENMGFKLLVRARAPWNQRFEELKQHAKTHGNCDLPKHTPLGIWILNQRSQYKLMVKNKPSHMTEDRIRLLNEIGFDWRLQVKQVSYPVYAVTASTSATEEPATDKHEYAARSPPSTREYAAAAPSGDYAATPSAHAFAAAPATSDNYIDPPQLDHVGNADFYSQQIQMDELPPPALPHPPVADHSSFRTNEKTIFPNLVSSSSDGGSSEEGSGDKMNGDDVYHSERDFVEGLLMDEIVEC